MVQTNHGHLLGVMETGSLGFLELWTVELTLEWVQKKPIIRLIRV